MSFNNRPEEPAQAQFFLKLISENEMDRKEVKTFYSTVEKYSPQNVLSIYETSTPDNEPAQASLVHRKLENDQHEYEIPLVRNLTPNEIIEVMNQLEHALLEKDFLFETSTFDEDCCINEDHDDLYVEPELTEQLASSFAERAHSKWLHERMDKGWRYGNMKNESEKVHPLLKPWQELPEEHRAIDFGLPQLMIDILEESNYTIISHDELNELIEMAEKKRK